MTSLRVAFYLRVSTGEQSTDNQRLELEAVAQARGWVIVGVYEDHGVSGSKGRQQRPQLDRMLKDAVRGRFDLLAAWAVDRLGRSLQDLVATLADLQASGVGLYLHRQAVDTSTPSGRAMFGMLGVFAEFERAMIQERVRAGLERARKAGKILGRPRVEVDQNRRGDLTFEHVAPSRTLEPLLTRPFSFRSLSALGASVVTRIARGSCHDGGHLSPKRPAYCSNGEKSEAAGFVMNSWCASPPKPEANLFTAGCSSDGMFALDLVKRGGHQHPVLLSGP